MDRSTLLDLLAAVERGDLTPAVASERLSNLPFEDLGHTRIDHHRALRSGLPEVIYAAGKSAKRIAVELNREKVPALSGGDWGFSTIRAVRRSTPPRPRSRRSIVTWIGWSI